MWSEALQLGPKQHLEAGHVGSELPGAVSGDRIDGRFRHDDIPHETNGSLLNRPHPGMLRIPTLPARGRVDAFAVSHP